MRIPPFFPLAVVVLLALLPLGCGSENNSPAGSSIVASVRITPSAATLIVAPGEEKQLSLTLEVLYSDGRTKTASGVDWSGTTAGVGAVGSTGIVTASGAAQGSIAIAADWQGEHADLLLPVYFGEEVFVGMAESARAVLADGTDGAAADAPAWDYPQDGTLFPAGLTPPLFQWNAGSGEHVAYELTLIRDADYRLVVYTTQPEFQPSRAQWLELGSSYGEPLTLQLVGKAALAAASPRYHAPAREVLTADADLAGLVHYRSIERMNIMRIDTGADAAALPLLARSQTATNCHGCHSAAQDGSRLFFAFWNNFNPTTAISNSWAPEPLAIDNIADPAVPDPVRQGSFVTIDPTGTKMVSLSYPQSHGSGGTAPSADPPAGIMALANVTPGLAGAIERLADLTALAEIPCDLPRVGACTVDDGAATLQAKLLPALPSWSPDGSRLAYIARSFRADWAYTGGDLLLMDWDRGGAEFHAPSRLAFAGSGTTDRTLSYPSWSPDSKWLAVLQGPYTERFATDSYVHLVDPRSGTMTRLTRGGADGLSGHPAFTPFIEGGHYWILFHSKRPYGHKSALKQLWVMAVDSDVSNGVDGSHPAFWLPGQELTTTNIQGAWSRPACRPAGIACSADSDCCNGLACDTGSGLCAPPDACIMPSLPCTSDAECCAQSPGAMCRPDFDGVNVCQVTEL